MIKKRGRLLTLAFSMCPGLGHMWNGFMKRGISLTVLFGAAWTLAVVLNIEVFQMLIPIIWFYAFFDCINLRFQDDQDFYAQRDDFLFSLDDLSRLRLGDQKIKLLVGGGCIFVGAAILWDNVVLAILRWIPMPEIVWNVIGVANQIVPQIIVALVIIVIGIHLIRGDGQNRVVYEEEEPTSIEE